MVIGPLRIVLRAIAISRGIHVGLFAVKMAKAMPFTTLSINRFMDPNPRVIRIHIGAINPTSTTNTSAGGVT